MTLRIVSRMQWRPSNEGSAGKMCSCQAVAHFVRESSKGQLGSLQVARSPQRPTKQTLASDTILWPSPVDCRMNSGPGWCEILARLRKEWLYALSALIIPSCSLRVEARPNLVGSRFVGPQGHELCQMHNLLSWGSSATGPIGAPIVDRYVLLVALCKTCSSSSCPESSCLLENNYFIQLHTTCHYPHNTGK